MTDIVLVHGAWAGAWCWKKVLPALRAPGHRVHAVTLTGVGERAHLLSPAVTLRTHVQDVLGVIAAEELADVVLVGHSYGGMVITGVADAAPPGAIRRLVYVDAVVPLPGESWSSRHAPETVAQRVAAAEASGGLGIPPPDPAMSGLTGADHAWVERRQTPQPLAVYRDPLHFDAPRWSRWPRCFIDCNAPALPTIDPMRARVREQGGWEIVRMATGHSPMVSEPEALTALLLRLAT